MRPSATFFAARSFSNAKKGVSHFVPLLLRPLDREKIERATTFYFPSFHTSFTSNVGTKTYCIVGWLGSNSFSFSRWGIEWFSCLKKRKSVKAFFLSCGKNTFSVFTSNPVVLNWTVSFLKAGNWLLLHISRKTVLFLSPFLLFFSRQEKLTGLTLSWQHQSP